MEKLSINDRLREYHGSPVFRNFGQALVTAWYIYHCERYGRRETEARLRSTTGRIQYD